MAENDTQRSTLITGAASGIGRATAEIFADAGWLVGLIDRDKGQLEAVMADMPGHVSAHAADVTDYDAMSRAVLDFTSHANRLDALFNCAGLLDMHMFSDADLARLHAIVDVNIKGVINGIKAALPAIKRTAQSGESSHIITMSSLAAVYGVPEEAVYSASKFAVRGMTEALNIELARDNIWVSDVMVGYVDTPMVNQADHQAKSVGLAGVHVTPQQVAQTVWQAVTGDNRTVHWLVGDIAQQMIQAFATMSAEEQRASMVANTGF